MARAQRGRLTYAGSDSAFIVLPSLTHGPDSYCAMIFLFFLPYQLYRCRSFSRRAKVTFIAATIAILLLWVAYGCGDFDVAIGRTGETRRSQLDLRGGMLVSSPMFG